MDGRMKRASERPFLDRCFGLTHHQTDVRTELIAGVTTFLTMVYIVFVNPQILGNAGMDKGAVFVATCIAAAVSSLVMGLYANYPIALAPGMGLNAFFAFTVVLGYKYTWQQALAGVFVSNSRSPLGWGCFWVLLRSKKRRSWSPIPRPWSRWAISSSGPPSYASSASSLSSRSITETSLAAP
jgi:hypothetical protein